MLGPEKEFFITEAWTHGPGPGHGAVYQWKELSVIPLSYSGAPNWTKTTELNYTYKTLILHVSISVVPTTLYLYRIRPWSSCYGRRLVFTRSQVRIPGPDTAWSIRHINRKEKAINEKEPEDCPFRTNKIQGNAVHRERSPQHFLVFPPLCAWVLE